MKSFFRLLVLLIPLIGDGQNYQDICTPGITFFKAPDGYLKAFRQDSVYPVAGNDTVFLSYRAIRDTSGWYSCRDTTYGSLLGLKVYKKNNGTFFFFNRYQDTLHLNTQAGLNQSWSFFILGNDSRIDATVTQIITDSVLGVTDQVKVITFQAKDKSNQNIPHLMNGREIRLSQHYGLSLMYDVYRFPADTLVYTLCGKTSLSLGLQDISWADIYNFDPGDEFHSYGEIWYYPYITHQENFTIRKILVKETHGNNDSVTYHVEYCYHSVIYSNQGPIVYNYYDTITERYNFTGNTMDPFALRLPEEYTPDEYYINGELSEYKRNISGFGGRITQENQCCLYYYNPCWEPPVEGSGGTTYSVGLGQTSWFDGGFDNYTSAMVYYKKGSQEWGTPLAPDCSTLVPVSESIRTETISVEITPNPVWSVAAVRVSGITKTIGLTFSLFDGFGRKIRTIPLPGNVFTLNREGLPSGLYLYTLADPQVGTLSKGRIILN
jgi:hypothetical protein